VLLTIWFENADHGIAAGAFGFAMSTHDGGRTWKEFTPGAGDDRDRHLNAVFAAPGGPVFIAAEAGTVFRSSDGGASWRRCGFLRRFAVGRHGLKGGGVACPRHARARAELRGSGKTWIDVPTGTDKSWTGGLQLADGTIVLVGLGARSRPAQMTRTFRTTIRPERQTLSAVTIGPPASSWSRASPASAPTRSPPRDGRPPTLTIYPLAPSSTHRRHDMDMTTRHLISDAANAFLAAPKRMLIGADWVDAADGAQLDVRNPATGEVFAQVPAGKAADVDRAVRAARTAFEEGPWPAMSPVQRERLLLALADKVEANAQELAELESLDNGKSVMLARHVDMAMAVDFLRYMAGWATKIEGATHDVSVPFIPQAKFFAWTRREPIGVVGAIIPWNFPLLMAAWKIGPALAAGCTVVQARGRDAALRCAWASSSRPASHQRRQHREARQDRRRGLTTDVAKIAFTGRPRSATRPARGDRERPRVSAGSATVAGIVLDGTDPAQAAVGAAQASSSTRARSAPPDRACTSRRNCSTRS
jgi:hypothetical protein